MDSLMEKFETFLKKKSLKMTSGREAIFKQAIKTKGHFHAESLYTSLSKKKTRVSRDAVFRNLPLLLEAGIIQKSVGQGKSEYYEVIDPKDDHHDHIICTNCSTVIEFFSKRLESIQEEICKKYRFKMTYHDHRIFGLCEKCQN